MVDKPIPVVPDTGTEQAARLATEITGSPGRWVRLDCQHTRHVQQPVQVGQVLECPVCPPSPGGALACRRVSRQLSEGRLRARLAAEPLAPSKARQLAAEAVTAAGPKALVDDAMLVASELVAHAIRHTDAPVELTVDTHDDVIRIEVRDDEPSFQLGPEDDPSRQGLQLVTDLAERWGTGSPAGSGKVVWCELRDHHARAG